MSMDSMQQLIALITALVGLVSTIGGLVFGIVTFMKSQKGKTLTEKWNTIQALAQKGIEAAEKSEKHGADKKQMVLDIIKAEAEAMGLGDISGFEAQLNAFIEQSVKFANNMKK